jgi:peptide/nickel transport system substrate-binding protein
MDEHELRQWIARVKDGTVSRRQFTRMMVGLGLTAPVAAQMLTASGVALAQPKPAFNPTKRGVAAVPSRPCGGRPRSC